MGAFSEQSKQVLNSYLSSVAYIDDEIFSDGKRPDDVHDSIKAPSRVTVAKNDIVDGNTMPETPHIERQGTDPFQLTKSFSDYGIQCALLQYTSDDDYDAIVKTIRKSDIVVLDWQMIRDDGAAAIKILQSFSKELEAGMHLFIVWTADTKNNLKEIRERIASKLPPSFTDEELSQLIYNYSRVIVCRRTVNPDSKSVNDGISPDKLPEFIVETFLGMTKGIVSNTLLKSIPLLRKHSAKLLSCYNSHIDLAYLEHRAMLPNPEDSEKLLINMIIDSFVSIVEEEHISDCCDSKSISNWIDEKWASDEKIKISKDKDLQLKDIKDWMSNGYASIQSRLALKKDKEDEYAGNVFKAGKEERLKFSKLASYKNSFTESHHHVLSLGSIVSLKDGDKTTYYVCVQQRCDSVRIPEDGRDFLFLPIDRDPQKERLNVILENDELMAVNTNPYCIKHFFFKPSDGATGQIIANEQDEFISSSGTSFKWLYDLKDLHAQRIAQKYASELSRVGLDEAEHIRRNHFGE